MAKAKSTVIFVKLPKDLPVGIERVQCKRTFGAPGEKDEKTGKRGPRVTTEAVRPFLVPAETGEGVRAYIAWLSEVAKAAGVKDDEGNVIEDYGVRFAAGALRQATVAGNTSQLSPDTVEDTERALPPIPNVRTTDPMEAAMATISAENAALLAESGKGMSQADIVKRFAALIGS